MIEGSGFSGIEVSSLLHVPERTQNDENLSKLRKWSLWLYERLD